MTRYLTRRGVLVEAIAAPELRDGKLKVPCRRVGTGGFHGWLVLERLVPVTAP